MEEESFDEMIHIKDIVAKLMDQLRLLDVMSDLEDRESERQGADDNETGFV